MCRLVIVKIFIEKLMCVCVFVFNGEIKNSVKNIIFFLLLDIRIKEEPDSEEWSLAGDSTLNTNDLSHLRVRLVEDEMEGLGQEGKRLRRVACTCPNCKEGGGR